MQLSASNILTSVKFTAYEYIIAENMGDVSEHHSYISCNDMNKH